MTSSIVPPALLAWLLGAFAAACGPALAQDEELLEPDLAFAFSAEVAAPDRIRIVWEIADGYYMYRDKYTVRLAAGAATLGEPRLPAGKVKQDPYFGAVEIIEHRGEIVVGVERTGAGATPLTIVAGGQGCNEPVGVCYPPLENTAELLLPALLPAAEAGGAEPAAEGGGLSAVDQLRALLGDLGSDDGFLPVDEAFGLAIDVSGPQTLTARFQVTEGHYLYQSKLAFVAEGGALVSRFDAPPGEPMTDEYFGEQIVYFEDFEVPLSLTRQGPDPAPLTVTATYQGCAERGICYPPVEKTFTLSLPAIVASAEAAVTPVAGGAPAPALSGTALGWLLLAFGTGLALTFTPCVLPMIPILSSVIAGQGERITRARGGGLALAYVLGTVVTYAAIGAVAGATGDQLQAYFQNIWAIGAVSVLFVVMALSMFGLYEIQMPTFIQSHLQQRSRGLGGGRLGLVFLLGLVSALIVGACVSPLLISVLSIAIVQGNAMLGAGLMAAMALGMGVILIAIGFGAGYLLPKAGPWMMRVKQVFGVLLLAVAIYLLGNVQAVPVLLLWSALFIVTGVYLGATQALPPGSSGWRYLWKGVGTILLIWGILAMLGGFAGQRDILNPLPWRSLAPMATVDGGRPAPAAAGQELFRRVRTVAELDAAIAAAGDRIVLLDYYADWCVDCIRMEKTTFSDPRVRGILAERFVMLQVDVTDPGDADGRALRQRYGVFGPPAILFIDPRRSDAPLGHLYGFRSVEEFLDILGTI